MLDNLNICNLVAKKHYLLMQRYVKYWRLGWKHYTDSNVCAQIKLKKTDLLEKAIRHDFVISNNLLSELQKDFVAQNLSLYLLLDMLIAWRYLASDEPIVSQEQLSKISNYALSPLSRIVLALYDENPAAYQPLCSLFIVYFWLELFGKKSKLTAKVKMSKKQKEHKMRGLYKDSFVILQLINSPSLKFKLAVALKTADIFLQKFANNKQQNLSFIDKIRIFLYAFWWVVSIKKQTVFKKN